MMKDRTKSRTTVLFAMTMVMVVMAVPAAAENGVVKLDQGQLPALVYIEGTPERSVLSVAAYGGDGMTWIRLLSGGNIAVTRLGRTTFLVTTDKDAKGGTVYVMDLATGGMKKLFTGKNVCCLRSEPGRGVAMLAEWDRASISLIELDLATFATQPKGEIPKAAIGGMAPTKIRISPDFARMAYATSEGDDALHHGKYTLSVLELWTMASQELVRGIRVDLPGISSFSHGLPPFEWLSNDEVVYQDMEPNTAPGAQAYSDTMMHVFKAVDVKTKAVRELFRSERTMALDGGSMVYDPVTGRIVYNREWLVDMHAMRLVPRDLPFEVKNDYKAGEVSVLWGEKTLYRGKDICLGACISPSGANFAYMLRPRRETLVATIYAKIDGKDEPVKVAEGMHAPTSPVGWIEAK